MGVCDIKLSRENAEKPAVIMFLYVEFLLLASTIFGSSGDFFAEGASIKADFQLALNISANMTEPFPALHTLLEGEYAQLNSDNSSLQAQNASLGGLHFGIALEESGRLVATFPSGPSPNNNTLHNDTNSRSRHSMEDKNSDGHIHINNPTDDEPTFTTSAPSTTSTSVTTSTTATSSTTTAPMTSTLNTTASTRATPTTTITTTTTKTTTATATTSTTTTTATTATTTTSPTKTTRNNSTTKTTTTKASSTTTRTTTTMTSTTTTSTTTSSAIPEALFQANITLMRETNETLRVYVIPNHPSFNGSEDLVCALREDEDHGDYEFETVCKNGKFIDTGDESRKTIMMSPEDDGELSTHYYVVAVNNFEWHDVSDTMVAINYPHNPLRSYYSAFLHLDSTKTPDRSWIVACFSPKRGWKTVDKMATLTFKDDKEFQDIVKMC